MRRIFITGGTGFIGGRLAEVAHRHGLPTVALVRTWSRAARLARLGGLELVAGDVMDVSSLETAMRGCDVVFHCAVDNRVSGAAHRDVSIRGTANVVTAAASAGVARVVHLSSTAVFGYDPGPDTATEQAHPKPTGDDYCDGKIEGERTALAADRVGRLRVTVIRPTIVYGPFGDYSRDIVGLIRQHRMTLVDGGLGICNSLYVDNLVDAMRLAATSDAAAGEIFHVSDGGAITWRAFIEGHARAIGVTEPLPELTRSELEAARRANRPSSIREAVRVAHDPTFRRALRSIPMVHGTVSLAEEAARRLLPEPVRPKLQAMLFGHTAVQMGFGPPTEEPPAPAPIGPGEEFMITAFGRVQFSIKKASDILGYAPAVTFDEGMRRTAAWLAWARA